MTSQPDPREALLSKLRAYLPKREDRASQERFLGDGIHESIRVSELIAALESSNERKDFARSSALHEAVMLLAREVDELWSGSHTVALDVAEILAPPDKGSVSAISTGKNASLDHPAVPCDEGKAPI